MVKKVDGGTPPDGLLDNQPPIAPPKPESPRAPDIFVDCTGKPRKVDCKPLFTPRLFARTIAPEEVQEVLKGIDRTINEIDRLIPQFENLSAIEDVEKLKQLRQELLDHRTNISSATDDFQRWAAARSYTESNPRRSNDLGRISAKIELPLAFDDFAKTLHKLRSSLTRPLREKSLESFFQKVGQQNRALKQLSPKERAKKGHLMIERFASDNATSLLMLTRRGKDGWPTDIRDNAMKILSIGTMTQ